jgi:hypothetical protein
MLAGLHWFEKAIQNPRVRRKVEALVKAAEKRSEPPVRKSAR